jgi:hypothetical protein
MPRALEFIEVAVYVYCHFLTNLFFADIRIYVYIYIYISFSGAVYHRNVNVFPSILLLLVKKLTLLTSVTHKCGSH